MAGAGGRIYAGIGARATPSAVLDLMTQLARRMEEEGWRLRSGGARGADAAFEAGVQDPSRRAIYLPGASFNQRQAGSDGYIDSTRLPGWEQALETVAQYHPAPERLSPFARDLMARNAMQVMGPNMDRPADLVVAYTPGGEVVGGTGQALRMAGSLGIPIRNLGDPATLASVRRYLGLNADVDDSVQRAAAPFEIVPSRGERYDVLGMRAGIRNMGNARLPGEPGWLGNPYVAQDAGGRYTRQEATDLFGRLIEQKAQDPAWRDAFLGLQGKRVGYYKPNEEVIHLHALQDWIQRNQGGS
jgi:hypothetical protein